MEKIWLLLEIMIVMMKHFRFSTSIKLWYNEINLYNYSQPKFNISRDILHNLFGNLQKMEDWYCSKSKNNLIIVMQFGPAGNFNLLFIFIQNVLLPCKSKYRIISITILSTLHPYPPSIPPSYPLSISCIQYLNKFYNCYWILKNHTIYFIVIDTQ
jgi:hypothetical protein